MIRNHPQGLHGSGTKELEIDCEHFSQKFTPGANDNIFWVNIEPPVNDGHDMEKRLYFVIGDLLSNMAVATIAVALTAWLIGGSWGMLPGMLAGMIIGMLIALPLALGLLSPLLGVMEVLSPCMISGMLGGMWGGMWPLTGSAVFSWGIGTGIIVMITIYILNARMSGLQKSSD